MSSPWPPLTTSLPLMPASSSLPARPQITSGLVVPWSRSFAAVPVIVQSAAAPAVTPRNDVAKAGVTTTAAATSETKIARVLMLAPLARSVREEAPDAADTVPRRRPGIQPGTSRSAAGAALLRVVDGQHVHRRGDRSPFDDDVELRSLRGHVGVQHREPDRSETWTGRRARERSHDPIAAANLRAVL